MKFLTILAVLLAVTTVAQAQVVSPVVDPFGDAQDMFGQGPPLHDIDTVHVWYDDDNLNFLTTFHNEITAPHEEDPTTAVYGFFEIDIDQNPATGNGPIHNAFFGPADVGVEYYLDFSFTETLHPNQIAVCDVNSPDPVGLADVVYGYDYIEGAFPLAMIGGDDGLVHFTWMAGSGPQPTDGTDIYGISVPEPTTLALLAFGCVALLRRR